MTAFAAAAAPLPRLPWRALAVLTAVVALVHLLLLGLAPTAIGPEPAPLAGKFITRTIVIAPPAGKAAAGASAPAPAAAPAPVASPKPLRPRATTPRPRPQPTPEPTPRPDPLPEAPLAPAEMPAPAPEPIGAPTAPAAPDPAAGGDGTAAGQAGSAGAAQGTGIDGAASGQGAGGDKTGPVALRIPGSVRLSFAVTGQQGASPMQGVFAELVWLQDGNAYDARLALTLLFKTLRSQHSAGAIGATGIEPTRFAETRRSEVASHFVRDRGAVVFSNNAPSVPLRVGAQDRLSVVMQLGALMAGDPARYPPGSSIAIQTVGPRDADVWTFQVGDDETLNLPVGDTVARRFTRNPRRDFDDKVELWIAPARDYLPVRIRLTQANGDFADMQLRSSAPAGPGK